MRVMDMIDFDKLLDIGPHLAAPRTGRIEISAELRDAALAIERVMSVAHEHGSTDAVSILNTVSALLRELARD